MSQVPAASIKQHFAEIEDPRIERTKEHQLLDIIVIAICAVICGADDWVAVENFGRDKAAWLKTFLDLPNGIPSHDTFRRVFMLLDAEQFQVCFLEWIQAVSRVTHGQVIAVDGKQLRRSHDRRLGQDAIYMVSAWATANHLVLGQRKVDTKSNEITAIPKLLDMLAIGGCIVTIDAIGCQKAIAQKIIDQDGDYVLALKENQGNLYADVQELFAYAHRMRFHKTARDLIDHAYHQTVDSEHGRMDIRECWTISDRDYLLYLRNRAAWSRLRTLVMVRAERRIGSETSVEIRYYISSLDYNAQRMLEAVRSHWHIENNLHWVLDVAFREDECRIRKGNGPQNFAVLRHIALSLLTQEKSARCGIKTKRLKAGWNEDYLQKVLSI
jgi:predicted transposase YbfD/YdcC